MTTEFEDYFNQFLSEFDKDVSPIDSRIVQAVNLLGGVEVGLLHDVLVKSSNNNMPFWMALIVGSFSDEKLTSKGVSQKEIDELNVLYRSKKEGLDIIRKRYTS